MQILFRKRIGFRRLTDGLLVAAEEPHEQVVRLQAALPQGQQDCDAAGGEADDEAQDNHEAEVGLAPHAAAGQGQHRPHNFDQYKGDDRANPDLRMGLGFRVMPDVA